MSWLSKIIGTASNVASYIPGIGPVASAALSGVSSIAGSVTAEDQLKKEQDWSAKQAQLNRDFQYQERLESQAFNKEMWNLNNEYNSPVEQLKRAQVAGINPNSAIDGMKGTSSQPVTTSPMSGATASSPGSIANSIMTNDAVVANLLAQTKNTEQDTANKQYDLSWNKLTEDERYRNLVANTDKIDADTKSIFRNIQHIDFDENMQKEYFHWFARKSEEELQIMSEQLNQLRNQNLEILANIRNIDSKTRQQDAQTTFIESQTEGQELSNQLQSLAVEFSNATGIPVGTPLHESLFYLWATGDFDKVNNMVSSYALGESVRQDTYYRVGAVANYSDARNEGLEQQAREETLNFFQNLMNQRPELYRVPNRAVLSDSDYMRHYFPNYRGNR